MSSDNEATAGTSHSPEPQTRLLGVEELVYTSAPKLLNVTGAHLGVVARSRDFSPDVETAVAKQWSYSMPAALNLPESQTLPQFYLMPVNSYRKWATFSRIQSAGFDHTGRTNPIAHHFAVDRAGLHLNGGSVASFVEWASRHYQVGPDRVFLDRWEGDPRELPTREVDASSHPEPVSLLSKIPLTEGLSLEHLRRACVTVAATILEHQATERMAVVIIRPSFAQSVPAFLGAVLASLPKAIQEQVTAISHVWEVADAPSGYSIAFTYPRSPFADRVKERADSKKPVIIDIALKAPEIPSNPGDYASLLAVDFDRWAEPDRRALPVLFDELDPAASHVAETISVKRALDAWADDPSYFSLDRLVHAACEGLQRGLSRERTEYVVTRAGTSSIDRFSMAGDWNTLFETATSEMFPAAVRRRAWKAIEQNFRTIASSEPGLVAQRVSDAAGGPLIAMLATNEDTIDGVLHELEARAARLTPQVSHEIAARWATLGTKILGRVWRRVSSDLARGTKPSHFCRRILDKVVPAAVVPGDIVMTDAQPSPTAPRLGLESLLRPAWAIVSRQLRAAAAPDPLCVDVFDRLAGMAIVPEPKPLAISDDSQVSERCGANATEVHEAARHQA